ncbi:MAG: PKD domain-containing protein [Candidatus Gracilibacteria bacterium]|nr:PKD domain-containing protein [Candidatus Gracilibacteria bacterium]
MNTLQDVFNKLLENKYDFVTIEPLDDCIKLIFRKDKVEKETLLVKYPVYTKLLIKIKTLTQLQVDLTEKPQEGSGDVILKSSTYKALSKTVPSPHGEKVFLKLQEVNKKIKKEKKPVSIGQILLFLAAGLFASLVIGGGFISFVLLNSSTVADLTFFNNLGVDVGSVRDFTASLVNGIFSFIIVIECLFLFTFTFKAFLTKKVLKKEKITRFLFAFFFLILTFLSGLLWITLSQKINDLKGHNYGKLLTYDNSKFISSLFGENGSIINTDENLIGPVTLRFDISEMIYKIENEQSSKIEKITWIFADEEVEKPVKETQYIKRFNTIGLHEVSVKFNIKNALGEPEESIQSIANLNIDNIIDVSETNINGGGKQFSLDASSLSNQGKIEWYRIPDLREKSDSEKNAIFNKSIEKPINTGYLYDTKNLKDTEIILGMKIISNGEEKEGLDKIFILNDKDTSNEISATIIEDQDINNDFLFTFYATDVKRLEGNGFIKEFVWDFGDITNRLDADESNFEESSEIEYEFDSYGDHTIKLSVIDSRGNVKIVEKNITIEKKVLLSKPLIITNNGGEVENLNYNEKLHEYTIDNIGIPTSLEFDARNVKPNDISYVLRSVEWDFDSDENINSKERQVNYDIDIEGRHEITVIFYFEHRKKSDDIIIIKENIYIESVKKDAILAFKMDYSSPYVPVIVSFDASTSQVKGEDIETFEWDYGDGNKENRDAKVPGYKYTLPGVYNVELTVVTKKGNRYSTSKKLVLKPKPQDIKITTSMKRAPILQGINFLSDKSEGQISSYLWDFGDGQTSTEANPTHSYKKKGVYKVTLRLDFANNNVLEEEVNIVITDDI